MTTRQPYTPGSADLAHVERDGEQWTLVMVRKLHHPADKAWQALTDPAQLPTWAPFDADAELGEKGRTVKLSTVGTPTPMVSDTAVTPAEAPRLLEYRWGNGLLRWDLQEHEDGTRLTSRLGIRRGLTAAAASSRWARRARAC